MNPKKYVLFFAIILILAACSSDSNYSTPRILTNCEATDVSMDFQQFNSEEDGFTISYPVGWYLEEERDTARLSSNFMFADTSMFFTDGIVNTLQITVQDGELPDDEEFMQANIQEVKRRHKVREEGTMELSKEKAYWLLVNDPRISTLMYTLSANNKFYTINLSTTETENPAAEFCLLYDLLETFQLE